MSRKKRKGSFRTRSNGRVEYRFKYIDVFGRTKVKSISGGNEKDCIKRADDWLRNYKESIKRPIRMQRFRKYSKENTRMTGQ